MPRISAERASAQRERILDAALTCFAREGFHAATMQDIVAESGLSPGAIYGYFKGKTEVVMAIATERHAMERQRMREALAAADLDTSLVRLIEGFVLGLRDPQEKTMAPARGAAMGREPVQSAIEAGGPGRRQPGGRDIVADDPRSTA